MPHASPQKWTCTEIKHGTQQSLVPKSRWAWTQKNSSRWCTEPTNGDERGELKSRGSSDEHHIGHPVYISCERMSAGLSAGLSSGHAKLKKTHAIHFTFRKGQLIYHSADCNVFYMRLWSLLTKFIIFKMSLYCMDCSCVNMALTFLSGGMVYQN